MAASEEFVDQFELDIDGITHIIDESGDVWSGFGVVGQPAWAFINDDGSVEIVNGALGGDAVAERAADLVGR